MEKQAFCVVGFPSKESAGLGIAKVAAAAVFFLAPHFPPNT